MAVDQAHTQRHDDDGHGREERMDASRHDDVASIRRDFRCMDQMFRSIRRDIIITQWMMAATILVQIIILVMLP